RALCLFAALPLPPLAQLDTVRAARRQLSAAPTRPESASRWDAVPPRVPAAVLPSSHLASSLRTNSSPRGPVSHLVAAPSSSSHRWPCRFAANPQASASL